MKLKEFFSKHPVFTRKEMKQFLSRKGSDDQQTLEQTINYHLKAGNIGQVKRGLFYHIPPGYNSENYPVDMMLVAAKMREDAVLAYHTAMDIRGQSHSAFQTYYFLTKKAKNTRTIDFRNSTFQPLNHPSPLQKRNDEFYLVDNYDRKGLKINVTSLERTIVDALNRPDLCGGWEEIWRSFQSIGYLRGEELIGYISKLGNETTAARTGFFLENRRDELGVKEETLQKLEDYLPDNPRYLDHKERGGTLIKRWKLIVPDYVLHKDWEE
ncbi:transcriptional regulator [Candidatus Bipolaricaulota bacterium]|nr:transcriptional regulator [Candidatus Bipolaricaulota bacterium]